MKKQDILDAAQTLGKTPRFIAWISFVLDWEIQYAKDGVTIITENVAGDAGGRTFAGIDESSHPNFPYDNPTPEDVVLAYVTDAWKPCRADDLQFPVGEVVANFAVNLGLKRSVKLLQTAINQFPDGASSLVVDGALGDQTVSYANAEKPSLLAHTVDQEADETYRNIVVAHPNNKKFLNGWLNRDAALEKWWDGITPSDDTPKPEVADTQVQSGIVITPNIGESFTVQ